MKRLIVTVTILLAGCGTKPDTVVQKTQPTQAVPAQAAVPVTPAAIALATNDVLACDRRSILYDPSKHVARPDPPKQHAASMKPGDTAWINMLTSAGGHVYVNPYDVIESEPSWEMTVQIKRVTDGFLIDCDSPELWLWLNEGSTSPRPVSDLIPVVGHMDVKLRKPDVYINPDGTRFIPPGPQPPIL